MTSLVELPNAHSSHISGQEARARWCCTQLEQGNILFFPKQPFEIPPEDIQFLRRQQQSGGRRHKNIAFRPSQDRVTGCGSDANQIAQLRDVMRNYSRKAIGFASNLLAPYAGQWRVDFTSFRPQEEKGRQLRLSARNDLLHTDSFPSRPANGDRILRIFTNVNARDSRVWVTSELFEGLARRFAGRPGLPLPRSFARPRRWALKLAGAAGMGKQMRSPYDCWMLRFHHFLKTNEGFQRTAPRSRWEFPPLSTWLVFTDMVSHAVLAGQFALEQTLIISRHSLVMAERAPVRILEKLAGCALTLD